MEAVEEGTIEQSEGRERATPTHGWRPKRLSYSAVDRYIQCPRSYYLSYVLNKKSPSNTGQLVGTLYGRLIEDAHRGKDVDWSTLKRYHAALPFFDKSKVDESKLKTVWDLFNLYTDKGKPPFAGVPEFKFELYLPECGPDFGPVRYSFLGYMDLLRERAISEHKTSAWIDHETWGWNEEKAQKSYQGALYAWAFIQTQGFEPEEVRFHILGTKPPLQYFELVAHPTMDRVLEFRDEAAKLVAAIENEDFAECLCNKCPRLKSA